MTPAAFTALDRGGSCDREICPMSMPHPCRCAVCGRTMNEGGLLFGITNGTAGMQVCPLCGNKRCPRALSPLYHCTRSNEPDQIPQLETRL